MKKIYVGLYIFLLVLASSVTASLSDNITVYYSFDSADVSGTNIYDLSDNSNNATKKGVGEPAEVTGAVNEAVFFDGFDDYAISVDSAGLNTNDSFTFSFWVNDTSAHSEQPLFGSTQNDGTYSVGYYYFYQASPSCDANEPILIIESENNGDLAYICIDNGSLWDSEWHHIAILYNDTDSYCEVWVDGINTSITFPFGDCSFDANIPITTGGDNGKIALGTIDPNYAVIDYGYGGLDEFRYWNRTLSSAEISEVYNSGRIANSSLTEASMWLWLPLNENQGGGFFGKNRSDVWANYSGEISGATWNSDNINITVPSTSYSLSGTVLRHDLLIDRHNNKIFNTQRGHPGFSLVILLKMTFLK